MKAIDIRYNLEYVGLQEGLDRYSYKDKLQQLKEDEKRIIRIISGNGCPSCLEGTVKEFSSECGKFDGCVKCWEQEA